MCYHFNLSCEEGFRTEKKGFYQKSNSNQKEVIQIKIAIKKRSYILKYATCIYILQIVINTRLQDAY